MSKSTTTRRVVLTGALTAGTAAVGHGTAGRS
jgi:hypothetical protein